MNISPVPNDITFESKIKYDRSLKKAFSYARNNAKTDNIDTIELSKVFFDNLHSVLKDKSKEVVDFSVDTKVLSIAQKKNVDLNYREGDIEGILCIDKVNEYTKNLPRNKSYLDTLKSEISGVQSLLDCLKEDYVNVLQGEIDGVKSLLESLKDNYSNIVIKELKNIEKRIKYSK